MPPADAEIAAEIDAVRSLNDVPRATEGWEVLGDEVLDAYLARTDAVLTAGSPVPCGPSTRPCTASARTS